MIVRWGLAELPELLAAAGSSRPLLVAGPRWDRIELGLEPTARWSDVPSDRIADAAGIARGAGADGVLAVGGGSAIDLAKAISAETGLPLVSVPTTYSGAEWTRGFGVRDGGRRMRGGGGGAHNAGILYEVELTLGLPPAESAGTALNALAHCAEALYVEGRNPAADEQALAGARLIAVALPRVLADGSDVEARAELLRGACHAGEALAGAGLGLAHAMAQAVGGRYGLPHGAMNALCLPPALRFNATVAAAELARLAEATDAADAAGGAEQLARLGGFGRLRDFAVPEQDLAALGEAAAARPGARANPRRATAGEVAELYRSIW